MNAQEKKKQRWIDNAPTEVLQKISDSFGDRAVKPSTERPLAGLFHIGGIGQIRVAAVRTELDRRKG